jgi:hypothetical protein
MRFSIYFLYPRKQLSEYEQKVFIFLITACADTFLSICRLNDGIQFHCDRVSVPFL